MLLCGHCGAIVDTLAALHLHLKCDQKPLELVVVENTSTNSDYATALRIVEQWMIESRNGVSKDFTVWCKERLNAEVPHSA